MSELLTNAEAAARLQPYMGKLSAGNWLSDTRRTDPRYDDLGPVPPEALRHGNRIMYRAADIDRVIAELKDPRAAHPSAAPAPVPVQMIDVPLGGGRSIRMSVDAARRLAERLILAVATATAA